MTIHLQPDLGDNIVSIVQNQRDEQEKLLSPLTPSGQILSPKIVSCSVNNGVGNKFAIISKVDTCAHVCSHFVLGPDYLSHMRSPLIHCLLFSTFFVLCRYLLSQDVTLCTLFLLTLN